MGRIEQKNVLKGNDYTREIVLGIFSIILLVQLFLLSPASI